MKKWRTVKIIDSDGIECWYKEGKLHREGGPARIWPDGHMEWYRCGDRHRLDGPAVTDPNGSKLWFKNGVRHREDGPAVIYSNGIKQWFLNGIFLTKEEWWERISDEIKLKAILNGELI
jgi:hypothetical protein